MIDPAREEMHVQAPPPRTWTDSRAALALRRPHNWMQLAKFCTVGASGYVVNLLVYAALLKLAGFHYMSGHVAYQGMRFLVVAVLALVANLIVLRILVELGVGKILAQAIAIVLVTPLNFVGNKLWSFRK
jgi:putative flippase GtrA